jgi:hypothetical protein
MSFLTDSRLEKCGYAEEGTITLQFPKAIYFKVVKMIGFLDFQGIIVLTYTLHIQMLKFIFFILTERIRNVKWTIEITDKTKLIWRKENAIFTPEITSLRQTLQGYITGNRVSAVRLNLDDSGDTVSLKLLPGRIHICDLHIYGIQSKEIVVLLIKVKLISLMFHNF